MFVGRLYVIRVDRSDVVVVAIDASLLLPVVDDPLQPRSRAPKVLLPLRLSSLTSRLE